MWWEVYSEGTAVWWLHATITTVGEAAQKRVFPGNPDCVSNTNEAGSPFYRCHRMLIEAAGGLGS